jgi:toxin secretion/phage lysis holin
MGRQKQQFPPKNPIPESTGGLKMKDTICVAVGLAGGFFTAIFGGWDSALVTLVVFMAIDFFTGIITAIMKKSKHTESGGLSSKAGWFGLAKKVCTLMLIVVAVRMDILLNTNYIRDAVCISFCLNELLSIVENTSLMGIPYPPAIKKAIDVLQTKIGRTEETTDKEDK